MILGPNPLALLWVLLPGWSCDMNTRYEALWLEMGTNSAAERTSREHEDESPWESLLHFVMLWLYHKFLLKVCNLIYPYFSELHYWHWVDLIMVNFNWILCNRNINNFHKLLIMYLKKTSPALCFMMCKSFHFIGQSIIHKLFVYITVVRLTKTFKFWNSTHFQPVVWYAELKNTSHLYLNI